MNIDLSTAISKGRMPANIPLTNISVAYLQQMKNSALEFFPEVKVPLSTGYYYRFSKEDLLRDDVRDKPILGAVDPTIVGYDTDTYKCKPKQIIMGLDEIIQSDLLRTGAPGMMDIKKQRAKVIAEKIFIHRNKEFAKNFFNEGAWDETLTGGADGAADFIQFDNASSTPIEFFDQLKINMRRTTGKTPNKLGLGIKAFTDLKNHPQIKERVVYGGSTPNPAIVTEEALAQILGIEKIVVFDAIWNSADLGAEENTNFICDETSALLVYATASPAIDTATAGYTFAWDMGLGSHMPIVTWEGPKPTYSEYIGGMMSFCMKPVCKDLGVFLKNAVAPTE